MLPQTFLMISPSEIVGFDPGVSYPAFAALDPRTGGLLRVSSFDGTKNRNATRINVSIRIYDMVQKMMAELIKVPGPKVIGIEGFIRNVGSTSVDTLGRFRQGIFDACMLTFGDLNVGWDHLEIPPASAKRAATGNGSARKEDVALFAERQFRVTLSKTKSTRYAEGDAIAIALATHTRWNRRKFDVGTRR